MIKYEIVFLEEAKEFLDKLDNKSREKYFLIFGSQEKQMIQNYLKS